MLIQINTFGYKFDPTPYTWLKVANAKKSIISAVKFLMPLFDFGDRLKAELAPALPFSELHIPPTILK